MTRKLLPLSLAGLCLVACSTASRTPPPGEPPIRVTSSTEDSSFEIMTSNQGHKSYRYVGAAQNGKTRAQSFSDKQLLKENDVDPAHYSAFVQKLAAFISSPRTKTPISASCRDPYRVSFRTGKERREVEGCRSSDDSAALGRLLREAEFLLYSKK